VVQRSATIARASVAFCARAAKNRARHYYNLAKMP
jgi:hypothetical protein